MALFYYSVVSGPKRGGNRLSENNARTLSMTMGEKCCEATLLMRIVIMSLYWMGVPAGLSTLA